MQSQDEFDEVAHPESPEIDSSWYGVRVRQRAREVHANAQLWDRLHQQKVKYNQETKKLEPQGQDGLLDVTPAFEGGKPQGDTWTMHEKSLIARFWYGHLLKESEADGARASAIHQKYQDFHNRVICHKVMTKAEVPNRVARHTRSLDQV